VQEEYFVDAVQNELYLAYNGTGKPPPSLKLGAVTLQNLLSIRGDGAGPGSLPTKVAENISVVGKTHDYCWHLGCILPKCQQ